MKFTLLGEFKPYVRMTRAGKFTSPAAQAYLASQMALALQFKQQCPSRFMMLPAKTPLAVKIFIGSPKPHHHSDLDNAVKALLDAAQGIVFPNDMWIDSITALRGHCAEFRVDFEIFQIGWEDD